MGGGYITKETFGMIRLSSGCILIFMGDWRLRLIKIENIKQNGRGLEAYMLTM